MADDHSKSSPEIEKIRIDPAFEAQENQEIISLDFSARNRQVINGIASIKIEDLDLEKPEDLAKFLHIMADKDYAPLSSHCVRALCDKMYDKRKAAALEIEKMTKECVGTNNPSQIEKLIRVLGSEFCSSQNPNMRKGGLIGLAAMSIGLGNQTGARVKALIQPVLNCMDDHDSRVRFYACESLYNVTKVARDDILPLFNDIFVAMSKVVTDLDHSVRTAAELMDRLLKDIITENSAFQTENFVPTLKQCMYTDDQFGRSFCVGWVQAMHKIPNPTIIKHLPEILDPMFVFLTDSRPEIYVKCQRELEIFLTTIKADPPEPESFNLMINNLVVHVQAEEIRVQSMSIHWIRAFAEISGSALYPYISGILAAILPNLSYDEERRRSVTEAEYKKIRVMSKQLFMDLMKILELQAPKLREKTCPESDLRQLESILDVANQQLLCGKTESKVGALLWINLLFKVVNSQMVSHIDKIFPTLLKTLSDTNDEVVILDLRVLAVICKPTGNRHFQPLMKSLYGLFSADKHLLEAKGAYIIRQLSIYLSPKDIYKSFAEMIQNETNLKFARLFVEYLNTIMFTAEEMQSLRKSIKMLSTPEQRELFVCLYKTWSHSKAPIVALVFLAGCYKHAFDLVLAISDQEVTMEFMLELDRVIQIIESPMFGFLRYELLNSDINGDLIKALYALLHLMPQTTRFRMLNERLKSSLEHQFSYSGTGTRKEPKEDGTGNKVPKEIDFAPLLAHFCAVQAMHEKERKKEVSNDVVTEEEADKLFEMTLSEGEDIEFPMVDE